MISSIKHYCKKKKKFPQASQRQQWKGTQKPLRKMERKKNFPEIMLSQVPVLLWPMNKHCCVIIIQAAS